MQLSRETGFTLVEMSVVLVVVALLLGSLLVPLSTQVEQRQGVETEQMLEDAREALIGFAMVKGRLPRPAQSSSNGAEKADCAGSAVTCTGFLPWAELGLPRFDGYGKQLRYSVNPAYTLNTGITFTIASTGGSIKTVKTRDSAGNIVNLVSGVPAVILSHGANNFGFTESGNEMGNSSATNADEAANDAKFKCAAAADCDNFMHRMRSTNPSVTGGDFDDLVAWVPNTLLVNRLVAAGRLP